MTGSSYISTSDKCHWTPELFTGVVLYKKSVMMPYTSAPTRAVELGIGRNVSAMDLMVIVSGAPNNSQTVSWRSSDSSIATVSSSGTVTGSARGDISIYAYQVIGSTTYQVRIKVGVYETVYVKNLYDSTIAGNNTLINNMYTAVEFLNVVYQDEFNLIFTMDGAPTQYANAAVDTCNFADRSDCGQATNSNCESSCPEHHKNVHRIADELYKEFFEPNHVVVMWSNCKDGIYCEHTEETAANGSKYYAHNEIYSMLALVPFEDTAEDRIFLPVIQFLTLGASQQLNGNTSLEGFMAITLAHEVAHTLGMSDVYNNDYYSHVTGHSSYNVTQCIMGTYDKTNASDYYGKIMNQETTALCADCIEILNDEMADDLYES